MKHLRPHHLALAVLASAMTVNAAHAGNMPPVVPPTVNVPPVGVPLDYTTGVTQGAIDAVQGGQLTGIPGIDAIVKQTVDTRRAIAAVEVERARQAALEPAQTALNTANTNYGTADQAYYDAKASRDRISGSGDDSFVIGNLTGQDAADFNNSPGATDSEKLRNLRQNRDAVVENSANTRDTVYKEQVRPAENTVEEIKNAR